MRERAVTSERQQFWHVIGFPHAGSYMLHAEGASSLIDSNSIAFFNPLGVYRTSHPNGCGDRGVGLVVAPDVIADAVSDWEETGGETAAALFPVLQAPSTARAFWIQNLLVRRVTTEGADPLEIEEAALALVAESVSSIFRRKKERIRARPETLRRRREGVDAARGVLSRHCRENIRLDQVARTAGLSLYHLCRRFKEETGVSMHRYLNRLRLRAALETLPDYRGDFTRLALDVGYSSHSHFTGAFRREFGMTPSTAVAALQPLRAKA